jgi:hypothetical protein
MKHVQAVESGKPEIEQNNVGRGGLDDVQHLETLTGLGHDFIAVGFEGAPQPIPHNLVIFGNDDSYHRVPQLRLLL